MNRNKGIYLYFGGKRELIFLVIFMIYLLVFFFFYDINKNFMFLFVIYLK